MKNTNNYSKNMGLNAFKATLRNKGITANTDGSKCAILYGDKLGKAFHIKLNISRHEITSNMHTRSRLNGIHLACAKDIDLSDGTHSFRNDTMALVVAQDVEHVLFLNEDIIRLSDSEYTITHEIAKQRKIHQCKECNSYYREACVCLDIANIRSYSYKPALSFLSVDSDSNISHASRSGNAGVTEKKAFIGVEWELTKTDTKSRQKNATRLFKFLKKNKTTKHFLELFQAVKEDTSVRNGFELVTHPFSASYYQSNKDSFEMMAEHAKKMALKGMGNGIHIHISKDAFDTETLAKWLKLFYNNSNVLAVLSGRNLNADSGGFRRWANIHLPEEYKTAKSRLGLDFGVKTFSSDLAFEMLAKDALNNDVRTDRYSFMNFNNANTIEYRLPASTTDISGAEYSNFCRHIELMLASFDYVKNGEIEAVSFAGFLDFLELSEKYVNLFNAIVTNENALGLILGNNESLVRATALEMGTIERMDMSSRESIKEAQEAISRYLDNSEPLTDEAIYESVTSILNKTKKRGA